MLGQEDKVDAVLAIEGHIYTTYVVVATKMKYFSYKVSGQIHSDAFKRS